MVKVRLIEKSANSHVGNVMVVKVTIQYKTLGMTWKTKEKIQPIHPTMVEGAGGVIGGGGRCEEKPDTTEKLAVKAGIEVARDRAAVDEDAGNTWRGSRLEDSSEGSAAIIPSPVAMIPWASMRARWRPDAKTRLLVGFQEIKAAPHPNLEQLSSFFFSLFLHSFQSHPRPHSGVLAGCNGMVGKQ